MDFTNKYSTCAFTGHRPESLPSRGDENSNYVILLKKEIKRWIYRLYELGVKNFITGCALGIDMWAGEIVEELRESNGDMYLHAVIPYMGQARAFSHEDRVRYDALIEKCDKVTVLSSVYSKNVFSDRNKYLVDNSDIVLAVFDEKNIQKSGTGQTVRYAIRKKRDIVIIDPVDLSYKTICENNFFGK